ncbi:protein-S-isoprenylcysteine O-methyltransferase Ste14 [Paenibacillus sp. BK033]|uniref:methyltransferase family protein n=1 Tax=Paenibacillus sp. BK033 TaxID=2512133 RepID=UPI0010EB478D|nr:isoprenylcysteine carboxylmethyltransferase family protein [Paenibacillus sp. BK033]TCN01325.1 protein-S-isoprenylcysteine O-methyltransferase Ste14 [Paenibacillus sp. BK033]
MDSAYFANAPEQIAFYCIIALAVGCELAIRIYADLNSYRSRRNSKRSDSGSIFIVVLGLSGTICLSFFLASDVMPVFIKQLELPHLFYFFGIILIILGIVLRVASVLTLRKYFTVTVQTMKNHQLIQSGVYKHLRNPSYTGLLFISVGVAFSLGNVLAIICSTFIFTLCLHVRIKVEEKALREQFKKEFDEYCSKTYRLIPFIW